MLSHISYEIDKHLIIQWFALGILHKNRAPLIPQDLSTYEEDVKKAQ